MPEWMTVTEWLDPKLLVVFVLIATVLFLSRDRAERPAQKRLEHEGRMESVKQGRR
jgi:hypothetical protein